VQPIAATRLWLTLLLGERNQMIKCEMTKKDFKLLRRVRRNKVIVCLDYIFLVTIWMTAFGYYHYLGSLTHDEQLISTSLTAIVALDIIHRKRELRLAALLGDEAETIMDYQS
jgi:hypothetical protein